MIPMSVYDIFILYYYQNDRLRCRFGVERVTDFTPGWTKGVHRKVLQGQGV